MFTVLIKFIVIVVITIISTLSPSKTITGIENYSKESIIKKYGGDLDSDLSIFPDDIFFIEDGEYYSSLQTNLFDTDGYIILIANLDEVYFSKEAERLKGLNATVRQSCKENADIYTNHVKYDDNSYPYPAYVTIDGFGHTYEYALLNEDELKITYVYLSYPKIDKPEYMDYLKMDKSVYSRNETTKEFSMYNHSWDNGQTFMEISDCK